MPVRAYWRSTFILEQATKTSLKDRESFGWCHADSSWSVRKLYLAKACCEMPRRDGAIVAWHEVPGPAPPRIGRPVGCGVSGAANPRQELQESGRILSLSRLQAFEDENKNDLGSEAPPTLVSLWLPTQAKAPGECASLLIKAVYVPSFPCDNFGLIFLRVAPTGGDKKGKIDL
jgi:hypothetical protein